jgi:hypothetical protein
LTLQCNGVPRPVHITASNIHVGVTIGDLLESYYAHLRTGVSQKQFFSFSLDKRKRVTIKFEKRCNRYLDRHTEKSKGLKIVDVVQGIRWLGLTATKVGPNAFMVNLK